MPIRLLIPTLLILVIVAGCRHLSPEEKEARKIAQLKAEQAEKEHRIAALSEERRQASKLDASMWRFHFWDSVPTNRTFCFYDGDTKFSLSAQDRLLAGHLGQQLQQTFGWRIDEPASADFVLTFHWSQDTSDYSETTSKPIIGQVSGGTAFIQSTTYGPLGPRTAFGTVTASPRFGIVGTKTKTEEHTITTWRLNLYIYEVGRSSPTLSTTNVFEGHVACSAADRTDDVITVTAGMFDALLKGFPGPRDGVREWSAVFPRNPILSSSQGKKP
jgi:hypothetical protein